jgi:lipopolysaccharide/colanic/teichoic acid biosynthesis glycosyltransferase
MTDIARNLDLALDLVPGAAATASASTRRRLVVKRAIDFGFALAGLAILAPVLLILAIIVKLDSPGPAFFRQIRVGARGRRFSIVKFRTMVRDAEHILDADPQLRQAYEANDFKLAVDDDPRITRIGRFLRATSLDELPQLWNVLWGDMSLVGMRPIEPAQVSALYREQAPIYYAGRPGLTGLWQVSGRSEISDDKRARLDLEYAENWSLGLDVRILLRTVPAVLTRRGAH